MSVSRGTKFYQAPAGRNADAFHFFTKNATLRVRCIFVNAQLWGKKPVNAAYPDELVTLGDHLRKVRLDRGLSQPQVARLFKVAQDSITGWELNRNEPQARFAKKIIQFLGYLPFKMEDLSIGCELYQARLISGMTQKQVAKEIGCDESNLRRIELGLRKPRIKILHKIECFIYTHLRNTKE